MATVLEAKGPPTWSKTARNVLGLDASEAVVRTTVENLPGAELVTAAREGSELGSRILPALREGRYLAAAQAFGESTAAYLGAIPGIPALGGVIKAYHGTPHEFDKFDMSKIGTGEGAQAYGHGLYFAENEGVAGQYRTALSKSGPLKVGDRELHEVTDDPDVQGLVSQVAGSIQRGEMKREDVLSFYRSQSAMPVPRAAAYGKAADILETYGAPSRGSLYHVELDVDHDELLDWDAPLSQQSPKVREKLHEAWLAHSDDDADKTGATIYNTLARTADRNEVSRKLREAGIPGIRYLDAGSRGAKEGTRNIVMFDDSKVRIVERK